MEVSELSQEQQRKIREQDADEDRRTAKAEIMRRYPPYKVPSLNAAIREAKKNIERFQEAIEQEQATIANFTVQAKLCEQRDQELRAAGLIE